MDRLQPQEPSIEELQYYEQLARQRLAITRDVPQDPPVAEALVWSADVRLALMRLIRTVQRHQGRVVPDSPMYDRPPVLGKFGRHWPHDVD